MTKVSNLYLDLKEKICNTFEIWGLYSWQHDNFEDPRSHWLCAEFSHTQDYNVRWIKICAEHLPCPIEHGMLPRRNYCLLFSLPHLLLLPLSLSLDINEVQQKYLPSQHCKCIAILYKLLKTKQARKIWKREVGK